MRTAWNGRFPSSQGYAVAETGACRSMPFLAVLCCPVKKYRIMPCEKRKGGVYYINIYIVDTIT